MNKLEQLEALPDPLFATNEEWAVLIKVARAAEAFTKPIVLRDRDDIPPAIYQLINELSRALELLLREVPDGA